MAQNKTRKNHGSVRDFLAQVEDPGRRADAERVLGMMRDVTGDEPAMWGASLVGFGSYHYRYASGREGEWFLCGFSPRKRNITLYIMPGFSAYDGLMGRLGKHKTGKSCLYINKLADVDEGVLRELVEASVAHMRAKYG